MLDIDVAEDMTIYYAILNNDFFPVLSITVLFYLFICFHIN